MFKNLSNEIKDFKFQITIAALLYKQKMNGNIEYSPVYFNSATKTVIKSDKYDLDKCFQEILYRIEIRLMKDLVG